MITSPTDISNCLIWLDASDTTTLSSFSALDVDATNNRSYTDLVNQDQIGFWGNKASNQYNFLNSFGLTGNRPFYNPSLSALDFTSQASTFLTTEFNSSIGNQTVVVLTMPRDSVQGFRIFTQNISANHDWNLGTTTIPLIQGDNNGGIGTWWNGNYRAVAPTTRAKGKFLTAYYSYDTVTAQISTFIDNNIVFRQTTSSPAVGTQNITRMRLGARLLSGGDINGPGNTSESNYDGLIREVIVYDKRLTLAERGSLLGYLSGKWDLERHQENAVYALSSGDWDSILWSTSGIPDPNKDTVYSNGFSVNINRSLSAHIISNRFGDGTFILGGGVTLSASLILGGGAVRNILFSSPSPNTSTIFSHLCCRGNWLGGVQNSNTGNLNISGFFLGFERLIASTGSFVLNSSLGVLGLTGSITGSTGGHGIENSSAGTVFFTGSARGDTGGHGLLNSSIGTIFASGAAQGGGATRVAGIRNISTGTVNFTGTVIGGWAAVINNNSLQFGGPAGIINDSSGIVNIYGQVFGGNGQFAFGVRNVSLNGVVNIYGDVFGNDLNSQCAGLENSQTGICYIKGNVYGGNAAPGCINGATTGDVVQGGVIIIDGNAFGGQGSGATGAFNRSIGSINVKNAVGNGWGRGSPAGITGPSTGITNNSVFGIVTVQELQVGPRGVWPTAGNIYINHVETSQLSARGEYFYSTLSAFDTKTNSASGLIFFTTKLGGTSFVPAVSNVRLGTVYDIGTKTGTLILPIPAVVLNTEPLDTGFGSANFDTDLIWQAALDDIRPLPSNSIGRRLLNSISIEKTGEIRTRIK